MKREPFVFALLAAGMATPAFAEYTINTLTSFAATSNSPSDLILSGNTLYGTASSSNNTAIVFSLPITGGTPTVLASFESSNSKGAVGLILSGSRLYGAINENTGGGGTIFSVPRCWRFARNIGVFHYPAA